ncbi:MAG TPA: AsmA family protein [Candidatus Sulfotelmatobacter sp.]|nr:AsmA family protein [Candidatus Sulfotelmatobacter sp.]
MSRLRKYGGIALLILALLVAVQVGVSFLVKTHRMRGFLIAHLESAFGRPVQVGDFSIQILPMPELDMDGVTIGEDPAFGSEYFLRAERMTASFRWMGLLRGSFQFGTMSLTRPSLILVRNAAGRWNLEGWLPPAQAKSAGVPPGPSRLNLSESTHRLQKIEFDEGRINFKQGDEKRPFAFINVSGTVEQVSPGRWRLRLEAQPWRSGVALQSTGTLLVVGDVAGTSARLQPAQIRLHWEKVSLADLFRLITGNDPGVRGEFALDGNANVGVASHDTEARASEWRFELQARATQIHRWDLTERSDNPRVNVNVKGLWDIAGGEARAEELRVEMPRSNLSGSAVLQTSVPAAWRAQFKTMAIQAQDLLDCYRAFLPDLAEGVAVSDSISGHLSVSGWPLRWDDGVIEGKAGILRVPGLDGSRIDPFRGSVRNGKFSLEDVRLRLAAAAPIQVATEKTEKGSVKARATAAPEDSLQFNLSHDSSQRQGGLKLNLRLADATQLFKLATAFGRRLNQGWEYTGGASGVLTWDWGTSLKEARRSGSIELTKSQLEIAGLNQPLKIDEARLEWREGKRSATIGKVDAFGASWSGTMFETAEGTAGEQTSWRFQLHADHLDAAELDRWFGPRARPNWLQRLLPSLLGGNNAQGRASELLRRVSAEGELTADTLTIEKIKLTKARATLAFRNLRLQARNGEAEWAGGRVRGEVRALFTPLPSYEVTAEIERINLAQLPWPPRWAERWSGTATGKIRLETGGVGREELLKQLTGQGDVKLSKIELRGWDVSASTESGTLRAGTSRWASGEGKFEVGERMLRFNAVRLAAPHARTQLSGTLGFDMSGNLTFLPSIADKHGAKIVPAGREFSLSGPLETPKVTVQPVTAAANRP